MTDEEVERPDLLAALQASIDRHREQFRAALDGEEQLTVITLTQPCGCPVGEGHRCPPPWVEGDWP